LTVRGSAGRACLPKKSVKYKKEKTQKKREDPAAFSGSISCKLAVRRINTMEPKSVTPKVKSGMISINTGNQKKIRRGHRKRGVRFECLNERTERRIK